MQRPIHVLLVEDDPNDAELIIRELQRTGFDPQWQRVDTEADYLDHLTDDVELILSDYSMPQFDGLRALNLLKQRGFDLPFIIISGTIGEVVAVEAMHAGAHDYMMKNNLARLGPAIMRELFEIENRRARRRVETALRESEDRYRDLVEHSHDLICTHDLEGRILSVNRAAVDLLGYDMESLLNAHIRDILFPAVRHQFDDYIAELKKTGIAKGLLTIRTKAGEKRIWEYTNTLRTDGVAAPIVRGRAHDVTEQRRTEQALKDSESELRALFAAMTDVILVLDAEGRYLKIVSADPTNLYKPPVELIGKTLHDVLPKQQADHFLTHIHKTIDSEQMHRLEYSMQIGDAEVWFDGSISPMSKNSVLWIARDITERKQAVDALRKAEEKYRGIFENAVEGIFQSTPDGIFISANPSMARLLGFASPEELIASRRNIHTQHYVDPNCRAELEQRLAEEDVAAGVECEIYRKDGSKIWSIENIRAIRDSSGAVVYYEGSIEDITDRKALEEQLRQAQKMEAIGQLAGGVAHDFNNLLTAIIGYSELAIMEVPADSRLQFNIKEIKMAGERAASLTRQLLAFSRKQVLQPKVLALNVVVSEMGKMLRRLIGENIDLQIKLQPELGSIKADPGQIEQVIMNLVVNARDAMPGGGELTIETQNVYFDEENARQHIAISPGPYVMLTVSDIGTGMDEQTQKRIFEPFFTTKETGKGTGLGLSTVYGIIRQSGGNISVASRVGRGTAFKVYLPRIDGGAQRKEVVESTASLRGSETILLAEDEAIVREITLKVLQDYGYNVLAAANGDAALLIGEHFSGPIQLLLSDVVMPKMGGHELADRLMPLRPEMKVLYMSGYTDSAIVHQGVLNEGIQYVQKPFTPASLVRRVREVLDR
jgi:two-component system, cell cycle sensor histidine kinase and response regulator CckA